MCEKIEYLLYIIILSIKKMRTIKVAQWVKILAMQT